MSQFCLKKLKIQNIEIYYNSIPLKILGDKIVKEFEIEQNKKKNSLNVDGIFIEIGAMPSSEIVKDLKLKIDEEGYIITDKEAKTNIEGVFAAGDVTNNKLKQIITAAAEGAIAAKSANDFLKSQ